MQDWFQTKKKNDDFTRFRYYKKKVIANIFANVSNQFENVK